MNGWRQRLAAKSRNAVCNSPGVGGAANSGPMIAKRSRAQRSRDGRSSLELNITPTADATVGIAPGNEAYKGTVALDYPHPLRVIAEPRIN